MEITWPEHQMNVLPYIYISFPQKLLFTQHRLLIVGNPKEQVKTPSLPTESQEMLGKDKNQEQSMLRAAVKRLARARRKGVNENTHQPSGDCFRLQDNLQKVERDMTKVGGSRRASRMDRFLAEGDIQAHFISYKHKS